MNLIPESEAPELAASLVVVSNFLLTHKPSHPDYPGQVKALREVKAAIAGFEPVSLAQAADPLDRRAIYERHIHAGGTLRDVARDLGLGYSTVNYYANRYLHDLVEISRANGRRASSRRLTERFNGEV